VVIGLIVVALLAVVFLPQLWVRHTIARHGKDRPDLQGTGGELARHLLDRFGMKDVRVEATDLGDHYDPASRTVRLLRKHHDGRSLSAVAIAAHEVGHAIQHQRGDRMLSVRQRLARFAMFTDRLAVVFFIAAPILAAAARHPAVLIAVGAVGIGLMAVRVVVDAVTLPVEYDASFRKALPILKNGRYVEPKDMPAIRSVLRAAALTYLAGALMALLNLARWFRVLR
jgi:Zn-dependent membrane protease YugP